MDGWSNPGAGNLWPMGPIWHVEPFDPACGCGASAARLTQFKSEAIRRWKDECQDPAAAATFSHGSMWSRGRQNTDLAHQVLSSGLRSPAN